MAKYVKRRFTAVRAGVTMALFGVLAGLGIDAQASESKPATLDPGPSARLAKSVKFGSAQIKDHSLLLRDLKLHQVPSYKEYKEFVFKFQQALTGLDAGNLVHKDQVYIKIDADRTFLHKGDSADNALKIDGLTSNELVQGHGQVVTGNMALTDSAGDLFVLIGLLRVSAQNEPAGGKGASVTLTNTSGQTLLVNGDGNQATTSIAPGANETITLLGDGSVRPLQVVVQGGTQVITVSLSLFGGAARTLVGQAVVGTP